MAEIEELKLEGTLCEQCGCYIGQGGGFPRECPDCKTQEHETGRPQKQNTKAEERD